MSEAPTLSVVMPAYNERATIHEALRRVLASPVDSLEIVVVDDGSTDRTAEVACNAGARVESLGAVLGVGFAIRRGYEIARAEGFDIAVVIAGAFGIMVFRYRKFGG